MKTLSWILATISAYFAPVTGVCLAVGAFIFADTIIGIAASLKAGRKFRSLYLRTGLVVKMLVYQLVIVTVFLFDVNIVGAALDNVIGEKHLITKIAALLLISIEATSLDEHSKVLTGKRISERIKDLIYKAKSLKKDTKDLL